MASMEIERTMEITRIGEKLGTYNPTRILEAMGHPGFGQKFAGDVLTAWVAHPALTLHKLTGCNGEGWRCGAIADEGVRSN